MKYALVFNVKTASYAAHALTCSAATSVPEVRHRFDEEFANVEACRAAADSDEQDKGGERAAFKVCKCAK